MFLIILQGWGFRDQNKDFDAFLASSNIWRGTGVCICLSAFLPVYSCSYVSSFCKIHISEHISLCIKQLVVTLMWQIFARRNFGVGFNFANFYAKNKFREDLFS